MSPLIYKKGLWATSGHLQNYAENMFTVVPGMSPLLTTPAAAAGAADGTAPAVGAAAAAAASHADHHASCCGGHHDHEEAPEDVLGLKPMNCPGHCLIFAQVSRLRCVAARIHVGRSAALQPLRLCRGRLYLQRAVSYRELPMRLADFSSLHRNEATGALGGMTRLRRFQQDDAHIFCAPEHIEKEASHWQAASHCQSSPHVSLLHPSATFPHYSSAFALLLLSAGARLPRLRAIRVWPV